MNKKPQSYLLVHLVYSCNETTFVGAVCEWRLKASIWTYKLQLFIQQTWLWVWNLSLTQRIMQI